MTISSNPNCKKKYPILAHCTVTLKSDYRKNSLCIDSWTIPDVKNVIQPLEGAIQNLPHPWAQQNDHLAILPLRRNFSDFLSFFNTSGYVTLQKRLQGVFIRVSGPQQHSLLLVISHNGVGDERVDPTAFVLASTKRKHDEEMNSAVRDSKE